MANITQDQIMQNISQSVPDLHQIFINLCLITGSVLFWIGIIWLVVNLIRYFSNKDKINRRLRLKRSSILVLISVILTVGAFLLR